MHAYHRTEEERILVKRCIAGDEFAWEVLCRSQHRRLLRVLQRLLHCNDSRSAHIDEIIDEVWHALIIHNYKRLRLYDPQRASLTTFLTTLALQQMAQTHRRDSRRWVHVAPQVMRGNEEFLARPSDPPVTLLFDDLCQKLSAREAAYVRELVFQEQPSGIVRSDSAHRKMKQRLFRRVEQALTERETDS